MIFGFGRFCVGAKGKKSKHPNTGGDMMLTPTKVVTFKNAWKLRDIIGG